MALSQADGEVDLRLAVIFGKTPSVTKTALDLGAKATTPVVSLETMQTLFNAVGGNVNTLIIDIEGAEQFINFTRIPRE